MTIRLSKSLMVLAIAFFATLVAFGNITDYGSNYAFVHHVFLMDTIFPDSSIKYRAIESETLHHAGYIFIIALETLTAILCWVGGFKLLAATSGSPREFNARKKWAVAGLTLGFLTWQVGFMSIGGEWFGMWMSEQWNGIESAFRFFITIIAVLIYLVVPDTDNAA
ncbi:DUF2165 family protein [Martelella mediterranea]|uniref:Putative small integral membrane protein n=1 Tax=Martelella mediterranea TaxID=293089 RepID=A0A4R3NKV4_9HYPH|nr:DUF2165 domain-containing protein [Martelella mediterranea]TCT29739.1 putative small integral membrane protein [Martelella mediterranea]TCT43001.1 putative small integral membrane protein [Martelella mediterranea]